MAARTPRTSYDKQPVITVPGDHRVWRGEEAWREVARIAEGAGDQPLIVVDAYPGADVSALGAAVRKALPDYDVVDVESEAAKSAEARGGLIARNLTDDRVFGLLSHHLLIEFYDEDRLSALAERVSSSGAPTVLIGWGSALVPLTHSVVVLADMARWEIQQRQRNGAPNWRSDNHAEDSIRKFKRGYFVEWAVADRHKRSLLPRIDFVLDTNRSTAAAKLITADAFFTAMDAAVQAPFRVVPFFDPGVWGGQWMKEVCDLDRTAENYAWCFDCVPEENSVLLSIGDDVVELPSIDIVFTEPQRLLGERTFSRFGAEFPIRFDFLDTMGGANLSLQVHPLTSYVQNTFGKHYTQDESYYLLDADEDAVVYLGTKTGVDPAKMTADLESAARGEISFPAEDYVNTFPAKKHDHFAIPAGTVHCSGAGTMVLEISATPSTFTFKMWDWDRLGLDGKPRPIHLDHAIPNIQWDRDTEWVTDQLVDQVDQIASGPGWAEERTGLHELEFIEVRRHWFTEAIDRDTHGTVHVLNLVEGAEAVVESPTGAFTPFVVHYAETFIIPAAVGHYTLRPHGAGQGQKLGTVTAYVRGTEREA